MTTKEKAKAYDDALKQAKKELNTCGSLDCDAARQIFRFFPQLRESKNERVRNGLIGVVSDIVGGWPFEKHKITKKEAITYLEKQKEQSMSAIEAVDRIDKYIDEHLANAHDMKIDWLNNRLKSLRPQPQQNMSISFMLYLDEIRPEGKMCLSNGECNDIEDAFKKQDWPRLFKYINKYQPHWKPSEEQMEALESAMKLYKDTHFEIHHKKIVSLYEQLKKLM